MFILFLISLSSFYIGCVAHATGFHTFLQIHGFLVVVPLMHLVVVLLMHLVVVLLMHLVVLLLMRLVA